MLLDTITLAATRHDQVVAEFLPNAEDMHIDQVRERVVGFVEKMFVECCPSDDFAAVQRQIFKDRVFARGERDRLIRPGDSAGTRGTAIRAFAGRSQSAPEGEQEACPEKVRAHFLRS